ncbi:MAG: flagellar hook basal-body protein [Caulobacterales bacterium]
MGLLEIGGVMMSASQQRLDVAAQNISNTTTPGYKKHASFQERLRDVDFLDAAQRAGRTQTDFSQGSLRLTGSPLDLAISGGGLFRVRGENSIYLSRNGQFSLAEDGRVVNAQGFSLQTADGEDLILKDLNVEILPDGTVLEDDVPIARIGLVQASEPDALTAITGTLFSADGPALEETGDPIIRQGMLESANIEMADEMVGMMSALRQAEIGARVVQSYDTLIGQAISTFGRAR